MSSSTSVLQHSYVFGFHTGVAQNCAFVDSQTVAYAAGYQVVLADTEDRSQKFINSFVPAGGVELEGLTCISLSPNQKFLAVAERGEKPEINIFDAKTRRKKKNLVHAEAIAKCSIVAMEFTHGGDNLVALSGRPDFTLVVFAWLKGRKLYDLKLAPDLPAIPLRDIFTRLALNPLDSETTVISGPKVLNFYRLIDDRVMAIKAPTKQLLESRTGAEITSLAWLKEPADSIVAGSSAGQMALYTNGQFQSFLAVVLPPGVGVTALASVASGLVCGCSDGGIRFLLQAKPKLGEAAPSSSALFSLAHQWHHDKFPPPINPEGGVGGGARDTQENSGAAADRRARMTSNLSLSSGASVRALPSQAVTHLAVSPNEDAIGATYADGQLRWCAVKGIPDRVKGEDMAPVSTLNHQPGHLTGLAVCVRKPLAVTCSLDRTVRIWDFEAKTLELTKVLMDDPLGVSFHPNGLHVAVGFVDKLRLMHVLMDDLRGYRELPVKGAREIAFSKGGHLLAAAGSSNLVAVFDFYTGQRVAELRGHSARVKSITWGADDATIVTCGADGALYLWDWEQQKRLGETITKGVSFSAALTAPTSASVALAAAEAEAAGLLPGVSVASGGGGSRAGQMAVYVIGSDKQLKELDVPELQAIRCEDTGHALSTMQLTAGRTQLFCGTGADDKPGQGSAGSGGLPRPGMLRAYAFPPTAEFVEFSCLALPVARLRLTHDDARLLAADESGCLVVMDVKQDREKGAKKGGGLPPGGVAYSSEMLITKADLAEKNVLISDLEAKVEELQLHNEYQLRLRDMSQTEKIKEIHEKFSQDLEQEKNKFELLKEEKSDMELEYEERLRNLEDAHLNSLEDEENAYQESIMVEVDEYQKLITERNAQVTKWEDQRSVMVNTHERFVAEVVDDFEAKLEEDKQLRKQLAAEKMESKREFDEMGRQLEDDVDAEIENIRDRYDAQLSSERELTLRFKGENGIMKKKFAVLAKSIDEQKEELKLCAEREADVRAAIRALELEVKRLKKEIRGRDAAVSEREKRIYDLKKKNQELEKFKFVLDFKIKELKTQIEPREAEIGHMKGQVKAMDRELERYHTSNHSMDLLIGDLRRKLDAAQSTVSLQRPAVKHGAVAAMQIKADLHECVQHIQEPEGLDAALRACVAKHREAAAHELAAEQLRGGGGGSGLGKELDAPVAKEYAAQKAYLEQTFASLKEKFASDAAAAQRNNTAAMRANMLTIREINASREANRATKAAISSRVAVMARMRAAASEASGAHGKRRQSGTGQIGIGMTGGMSAAEVAAEVAANKARILELRELVAALEERLAVGGGQGQGLVPTRPGSRGDITLPPMAPPGNPQGVLD